jgi:hypothetical protein
MRREDRWVEEARLYSSVSGWRCGDCLSELVLDDLAPADTLAPT